MITLLDIKKNLFQTGDKEAVEMVNSFELKAKRDPEYAAKLNLWLSGKSKNCTVLLRDELAGPFKTASFIKYYKNKLPMPWDNMWEAIDTSSLRVRNKGK